MKRSAGKLEAEERREAYMYVWIHVCEVTGVEITFDEHVGVQLDIQSKKDA